MRNNDIESSLKRFLKRKVKITLGVVVAFLITGVVGYGADIVAEGKTGEYTITEQDGKPKIIGGWNYTKDSADKNADHSDTNTNITLTSGDADELIGGNHLKNTGSTDTYISKIGNTSVTMNGGTVQYLIGGSKSNGTKADITNGKTKVIVNGGTIGQSDSNGVIKAGLIGGNYIKSTSGQGTLITAKTDETDVEITGGTFANKVIGGSFVDTYGTNTVKGLTVEDKETNLKISGGTFNNFVIGGGAAAGTGNTSTVGTSNLTIKGGIFNSNIYAGGAALEGVKGKNDIGTVRVSNSNLTIDGTDATKENLNFSGAIYAGGLDSGISKKITLTLKNLTQDMFKSKGGIYGGSKGSTEGALVEDGDIEINISNSHIYADILGGGGAFGKSSKVKAKNTKITVSNTSISGYENNKNTWTGRIFGAGMAQGGALFEQESTDVVINNVDGVTYDQNNGEVSNKVGVRIYGGGQNYKAGVDSQLKIGSTKVTIKGKDTALAEVYGGSIISGTGNKGTVSVGKTDVTINNGEIVDYVVGGNNTNWNGYSVVGIEDENGSYEYLNGKKYNAGSTNITINGGDMSTAEIIGGSYVDYGWYYENKNDVIHDGIVYGATNIDIKGGKIRLVVGGGKALYSNPDAPGDNVEVYPSTSNVEGTTNINITGGSLSGNIIGGGYAFSNQSSVESIANVTGTTNINISGGTIEKNIYGGGFADGKSAAANVEGDTNITISGGNIKGNIYAGGLVDVENGGTANVEGDTNITISGGDIGGNIYAGGLAENGGTANVTGNSTVTFLNGSTFAKDVYGTSKVNSVLANNDASKKSTLAFGNDKEIFDGEFKGEFSYFNILRTGKDSKVIINELKGSNVNQDMEFTGSGRIETKINNVGGNITLSGGENSIITVGDNGSAGKLVVETLQLNGGKMFLDPVWKEGEVNTIGNASKGAVIFDGTNGIDGQIAVGQNSVLVVGDKATDWAEKAFENSGLKWKDDITAALAIRGNQTLGTLGIVATNDGSQGSKTSGGSINVNGSLTGHSNENYKGTGYLNFADNSLLIVDTGSLNGGAAISGVKSLSVANTSKLYLENMTAGTHTILTGEGIGSKGWNDSNILNGDRMLAVTGNKEGNKFTVTAAVQKAEDVLQGVVVPNMINNIWRRELNTIRTNEGIKFLSRAIDKGYIADTKESVRTINEAVQIAGVAGVHRTGLDTIKRTSDTAVRQLSMVNKDAAKEGLWAEMSYGSTDVSGVKIGNTDTGYNGRYEGVSVGSNFKTWENGVLGGAFHYVSGENKSDEGVSRTKNEYEYFGLSLYNNLRVGNINIIGDLGYSRGDNEIKQYTKIERLKADIDTELMTAGIKGEYLIQQDNFNIVPYVGLRYVRLNVDSFDTKNDTGKLFHTEKEDADLFLVPVGVNISTQVINQSGWTVKPKLDLAYIGALGDKKSETKVGLVEYSAIDEIKVNMADSSAYSGSLGVEFKKDNKAFEVGYSLYSSKHETENRGTMSFKYNF